MRKNFLPFTVLCFVFLPSVGYTQTCPDPAPQTSGHHSFRRKGEVIDIPIQVGDCQPIALELRWSNGRNNGSNFKVTFLDTNGQPIYMRELSGFLSGNFDFSFTSFEPRPWLGSRSMLSAPSSVTIEAIRPFALPATISYSVTRATRPARRKRPQLDHTMAMTLQLAAGKLLSKGQASLRGSGVSGDSITYRLEEVRLPEPRTLEFRGKSETLETAFRLILTGGEHLARAELIWLDDVPLPVFRRRDSQDGSHEIGVMIYNQTVLKTEVDMSLSASDGSSLYALSEPLTLPPDFTRPLMRSANETKGDGTGNEVISIHSAVRTIGATRHPLVQIELRTDRPFPANSATLKLQIGKRFFWNELSGDHTGRRLTITLTPEMFADLKQGAEIIAFFDKPDGSGFSDQNIWNFGRLNKEMLKE